MRKQQISRSYYRKGEKVAIERKFIADNFRKLEVKEFLEKGLDRAGCGEIDIQRTPAGTRVIIYAQRPGLVIGRKGGTIRSSTNVLKTKYRIDNPQIEVNELEISELNAKVMAKSVASAIERGIHFRRSAYTALRRIMEAGARGVEIQVSGKLTGDRSKTVKFVDGSMKHCGDPALMLVERGQAAASPKQGIIGVTVKLIPPGVKLPDEIELLDKEKMKRERKARGITEDTEKLVEDIQEEIAVVEDGKPLSKTIKPEKVKRKAKKKKAIDEELDGEEEIEKEKKEKKVEVKKAPEKKAKVEEPKELEPPKETKTKAEEAPKKVAKKAKKEEKPEEPKKAEKAAKSKTTKDTKKKSESKSRTSKEAK
jgi:small subunit ribosomal protein S3